MTCIVYHVYWKPVTYNNARLLLDAQQIKYKISFGRYKTVVHRWLSVTFTINFVTSFYQGLKKIISLKSLNVLSLFCMNECNCCLVFIISPYPHPTKTRLEKVLRLITWPAKKLQNSFSQYTTTQDFVETFGYIWACLLECKSVLSLAIFEFSNKN